jgi:hypothetical protein
MEQYNSFVELIYNSIIKGHWAQIIGVFFIFFALWFSFKRRNVIVGTVCIIIAACMAYGTGIRIIIMRLIYG